MENFTSILNNYLSPNNHIRVNAEQQLNELIARGDPNDLDYLFQALHTNEDNNVKLFIAILIKKVFDTCINDNNRSQYKQYISIRKVEIVNTILNLKSDLKTINFLVLILENCINLFENYNYESSHMNLHVNGGLNLENTQVEHPLRPDEIFKLIFNLYNLNKSQGNLEMTFQQLYISFKLLKFLKDWKGKNILEFAKVLSDFYTKIFQDFEEIMGGYFSFLENKTTMSDYERLQILIQYTKLYFKIAKHSVNFFIKEQRDKIMSLTFKFLYKTLFYLNQQLEGLAIPTDKRNVNFNTASTTTPQLDRNIFDCIFLANKILIKYTACFAKLDLQTLKNFADLFYIYISENTVFQNLISILRFNFSVGGEISGKGTNRISFPFQNTGGSASPTHKEKKFITDIIDFFKELLQLTSYDNWGDLILFKDCFSEDNVEISNYLTNEFFTMDRIQNLIVFSVKNCMTFRQDEIEMAFNDVEEFYTYYDTMTPQFDLREKSALLCRIIYDKHKKNLKDFHQNLENELVVLTQRDCIGEKLTFEERNLKCGLLFYFEALAYIYSNKNRSWKNWVRNVLLLPLKIEYVCDSNKEIFSTFLILRILMKSIDFKEINEVRSEIFITVYEFFIGLGNLQNYRNFNDSQDIQNHNYYFSLRKSINEEKLELINLLKLGCIDFFYAYFDDYFTKDFPVDFLKKSIYYICDMLKTMSSPDIHNKIIKTTIAILGKFPDEEIEQNFPYIFSVLMYLWNNTSNENLTGYKGGKIFHSNNQREITTQNIIPVQKGNVNSTSIVRQNMIKLIAVFIKKIGIFITFPHSEEVNLNIPVDRNYFDFVYNIIGYSVSVKSQESNFLLQESLKLILLMQDEFYKINCVNKNLSADIQTKPPEFYQYFAFYFKIYDFLPIILYNISNSDDYYLAQFLIVEQYLSLIHIKEIKEFLFSIDIVDKLILIIKNSIDRHILEFTGPIFNFIEFCVYILNSVFVPANKNLPTGMNELQKINKFNNYVYGLVENIFSNYDTNTQYSYTNESNYFTNIHQKLSKSQDDNDNESSISCSIPNIPELNLFMGALQLSNRLIYINYFYHNVSNFEFYFKILNYLFFIVQNKNLVERINVNDKKILGSLIRNFEKIFSHQKDLETVKKITELGKLFEINNSSHFLDKNSHTLNHWLFFFNKMNNDTYFYQLTAMEDLLRHFWTAKLEKMNYFDVDLSNLNFDLKYYSLFCDDMYKQGNVIGEDGN